jgi:hypothetical protein
LSNSTQLTTIDWQAARFFSSSMLTGLSTSRSIALQLNLESLYGGVRPVPVGFFDPLSPSITVSGGCGQSCARLSSQCPYFVDGVCQSCPLGSFKRVLQSQYAYCSVCPVGFYCDAALSLSPLSCPRGSFQPLLGQGAKSSCQACPTGPVTTRHFHIHGARSAGKGRGADRLRLTSIGFSSSCLFVGVQERPLRPSARIPSPRACLALRAGSAIRILSPWPPQRVRPAASSRCWARSIQPAALSASQVISHTRAAQALGGLPAIAECSMAE